MGPHQGILALEAMGKDPVQRIPADIIVSIAGGRAKMPLGNPFLLEGGKDPGGVFRFDGLYTGEYRGKACLGIQYECNALLPHPQGAIGGGIGMVLHDFILPPSRVPGW